MPLQLKIFTLNCWGLAVVSKNRKSRFKAIGEWLLANPFDIVCLQEVWVMKDFNFLRDTLTNLLPYSHYFYSGVVGSGICILSKHPIEETFFHQWSVNGYIHKLHHGDWFGGKGVGLCRLKIVDGNDTYFANVYTTHLHAEYNRASDDYQAHRVLQAYDTAQFILLSSQSADLIVLAGDLNTEPGDLPYRVMLTVPGLVDSLVQAGRVPQEKVATCDSLRNSYTCRNVKKQELGKRIDYVMYHSGPNVTVNLKSYDLPMLEKVPKKSFSYSDHEGILVELSISHNAKSGLNQLDEAAKKLVLEECIDLCKDALKSIKNTKIFYWLIVVFTCILLICSLVFPAIYNNVPVVADNPIIFSVSKVLLTAFMLFAFLMATLWSRIEMHGVMSGKVAMEVSLKKISKNS